MSLTYYKSFFNIAYRKNSPFLEVNHSHQAMSVLQVRATFLLSTKWHSALEIRPELPPLSDWGLDQGQEWYLGTTLV